jgi:hypothetical protein
MSGRLAGCEMRQIGLWENNGGLMKDFANTLSDLVSLIFSGKLSFLETIGAILVLIAAGVFLHFFLKIVTLDPNTKITFGRFFKKGNVSKPKDEK